MKSGTPGAENGAPAAEMIGAGEVVGSVHATAAVTQAEKSFGVLDEIGATGDGCESGSAAETQQDLSQEQQLRPGETRAKEVWADASVCSQTNIRLRRMAAARFMG